MVWIEQNKKLLGHILRISLVGPVPQPGPTADAVVAPGLKSMTV